MPSYRALLAAAPALLLASSFDIEPARLPAASLGRAYLGGPLVATGGGMCPFNAVRLSLAGGMLPEGLTLAPNGHFSGAPSVPGTFRFLVRASNGCSWSDQEFTLEVEGAPLLAVNPTSIEYRIQAGQALPGPVPVKVSNATGSGPYTVRTTGSGWLQARARLGATPGRDSAFDSDIIDVYIDTASLPPGVHQAEVQVGAWRSAQNPVIPVTIAVVPRPLSAEETRRLEQPRPIPAPHGAEPPHPATAAGHEAPPAPKKAAPAKPVRKFQASKSRIRPVAPKATAPVVDPHAKPSPSAGHVPPPPKKEEAKPAGAAKPDAHAAAKPDSHAKPAEAKKDPHGKPEAKPAPDAHGKPAPAKSETKSSGDHGKSETKPAPKADSHAKPDQHAKAETKPKSGH